MPTEPRQPQGTAGVIYIIRRDRVGRPSRPSDFLVSFGGKKDGVGVFYLGKPSGYDALAALLEKVGVPPADVDIALHVIAAQPHHEIQNVTLTKDLIRKLGL